MISSKFKYVIPAVLGVVIGAVVGTVVTQIAGLVPGLGWVACCPVLLIVFLPGFSAAWLTARLNPDEDRLGIEDGLMVGGLTGLFESALALSIWMLWLSLFMGSSFVSAMSGFAGSMLIREMMAPVGAVILAYIAVLIGIQTVGGALAALSGMMYNSPRQKSWGPEGRFQSSKSYEPDVWDPKDWQG